MENGGEGNKSPIQEEDQWYDQRFMDYAEEELLEIEENEINAFGGKEENVFKQIDTISQIQVKAFLGSMKIECNYPNVINTENEEKQEYNTFDKDEFGQINKRFKDKEKAAKNIIDHLTQITTSIHLINRDTQNLDDGKENDNVS